MVQLLEGQLSPSYFYPSNLVWQIGRIMAPINQEMLASVDLERCLLAVAPALCNILPPEIRMALTLLAFQKASKTSLCTPGVPSICFLVNLTVKDYSNSWLPFVFNIFFVLCFNCFYDCLSLRISGMRWVPMQIEQINTV